MLDSDFIPTDKSLPEFENFYFDIEEKNSGSTTIHDDISLPDLECFNFDFKPDPSELTSIVDSEIRKNVPSATNVNLPPEEDHSPLFAYVVLIFLSFPTYLVVSPHLLSFENKDTIFDPCIANYHFSSLLLDVLDPTLDRSLLPVKDGLGDGFAPHWIGNNIPNNQNGLIEEDAEEEEEDLEEDPKEDPEEESKDDDDMEMDDEAEVIDPYMDDGSNNPPPLNSEDKETPPTSPVIPDADGQPIPPIASFGQNFHFGESSSTANLLRGNSKIVPTGPMCLNLGTA
nr:hypothetical protein [Tanacetum cinerariifolium]